MGVNIAEILEKEEIEMSRLRDKIIAVDAHLFLYQFLSTIRQRDGSLLMDSKGRITSHLSGLFFRNCKLMEQGIRLVYVFDGKPPELKIKEREKRKKAKEEAEIKYRDAVDEENIKDMRKFAARTTRLSREMIDEAKKLIDAMGIPIVEAPSEGEAQAAQLVKIGKAYAAASQDSDSLLFGSPRLVRNLSFAGRRKKASKLAFEEVKPELVILQDTLKKLEIDQDQLIALGMLVGTDFNNSGIKGIGPKNALKLVRKHGNNFEELFKEVKWDEEFDYPWQSVFDVFKKMPVKEDIELKWNSLNRDQINVILVNEHDFSNERVNSTLDNLEEETKRSTQKGLSEFF